MCSTCSGPGPAPPWWFVLIREFLLSSDSSLRETSAAVWCSLSFLHHFLHWGWKTKPNTLVNKSYITVYTLWYILKTRFSISAVLTWLEHTGYRASSTGSGNTHWPQRRYEAVAPPSGACCTGPQQCSRRVRLSAYMGWLQPGWNRCLSLWFRQIRQKGERMLVPL